MFDGEEEPDALVIISWIFNFRRSQSFDFDIVIKDEINFVIRHLTTFTRYNYGLCSGVFPDQIYHLHLLHSNIIIFEI